jgi:hypothetical protein
VDGAVHADHDAASGEILEDRHRVAGVHGRPT